MDRSIPMVGVSEVDRWEVPGRARRVWASPAGLLLLAVKERSNRWLRVSAGGAEAVADWPDFAGDLRTCGSGVLGLRARWLQGGKAATDELALLTGDGRTSSRRFPALVHDACWHSGTPVAGLADGRLLLMDMSLATQTALPIPHSSGWGPVTAVSGTADGGLLWAATWASLASYEQLRLRAVHDAPVAPVRTEEILASRRGEVAICRSPYITVAMTAEGRAGEALGCRHALADEEGMLVAQSDRRWQSLWGRSEPTPAEQPPAQFAHVAGGRIATWSGADVAVWERRDGAPWLVAHAKMRETVRQVVAREEGDSFLVVAGAVHELALLPD